MLRVSVDVLPPPSRGRRNLITGSGPWLAVEARWFSLKNALEFKRRVNRGEFEYTYPDGRHPNFDAGRCPNCYGFNHVYRDCPLRERAFAEAMNRVGESRTWDWFLRTFVTPKKVAQWEDWARGKGHP